MTPPPPPKSSSPYAKYALTPILLASSLFGAYAIGTTARQLGPVLAAVKSGSRGALLGAPEPFRHTYTGLAALDRQLSGLVVFFSSALDGDVPPECSLFYLWALGQLVAGWAVVLLEGLRAGNNAGGRGSGGVLAVTLFGLLFQNVTWTVALPLGLIAHLYLSPTASLPRGDGPAARRVLFARLWDLALLPISVVVSVVFPSLLIGIPALAPRSAATHYGLTAFWQFFPLWNVLVLKALHGVLLVAAGSLEPRDANLRKTTPGRGYYTAVSDVYNFARAAAALTHLPILALTLAPAPAKAALASAYPSAAVWIERATFGSVFVPAWVTTTTTVINPTAYVSGDLAPLATRLLQYDLHVGAVAFLLWVLYLHQSTVTQASVVGAFKTAGVWLVLGGPNAAVAALLKERDAVVLEDEEPLKKTS